MRNRDNLGGSLRFRRKKLPLRLLLIISLDYQRRFAQDSRKCISYDISALAARKSRAPKEVPLARAARVFTPDPDRYRVCARLFVATHERPIAFTSRTITPVARAHLHYPTDGIRIFRIRCAFSIFLLLIFCFLSIDQNDFKFFLEEFPFMKIESQFSVVDALYLLVRFFVKTGLLVSVG